MSQPDHTHIHTLVIFKSFAHESEAQTGESHWFTLITMFRTIFGVYVTGTEKDVNKEKNILHKKGRRFWSLLQVGRRVGNLRTGRREYLERALNSPGGETKAPPTRQQARP